MNNGYFPTDYPTAPNPGQGYGQQRPVPGYNPQAGNGYGQQQAQPYPRQRRAYYPQNWINDVSELDEYELEQGVPLFAFFRNRDAFVIRRLDDTGRPHDDIVPFEIPRQKAVTEAELKNYVSVKDFGALVREVQAIREQIGRGTPEVSTNADL